MRACRCCGPTLPPPLSPLSPSSFTLASILKGPSLLPQTEKDEIIGQVRSYAVTGRLRDLPCGSCMQLDYTAMRKEDGAVVMRVTRKKSFFRLLSLPRRRRWFVYR